MTFRRLHKLRCKTTRRLALRVCPQVQTTYLFFSKQEAAFIEAAGALR
jgi:hypothetical protein